MINYYKTHFWVLCAATIFAMNTSNAQTNIPVNTIVTQDFNGMNTGLTLPANWRVSAAGTGSTSTWATAATTVTEAANSGNPATGGAYNWGTTAGIDRAVGFMASGSYATPNAVMAFYRNTTGSTVTTLTISFMVEQYKVNTSSTDLSFFSSIDGAAWTPRTEGDIPAGIFATGTAAFTFNQPRSFFRTVTISGLNIANNGDIYFRWVFNDAAATTAQGLGLDNVSIYAGTATPVISAHLRDSLSLDTVLVNQANPDDQLRYTTIIKNTGSGDADSVVLAQPAPINTTLVPGSVKTSALARDESYTTGLNTPLNTAAPGLLTNDFGIPSPTVVSFGPSANSSAYAAGTAGSSDNGGALTVNADGSFTYTPPSPTFAGIDKFSYKATNGNAPDNDATVIITVGAAPIAVNDAYNVVGNVRINPTGIQNLLNNDGGSAIAVTAVNGSAANVGSMFTTANGSNITVSANGDFIYNPGPGFEGPESFTYTVDNGFGVPQTATVNITINGMMWFIANGGAAGDGRLTSPFNSIDAFQALNNGTGNNPNNNDNIFIYESATPYAGNIALALRTGQKLIGQDATATLSAITGLTPAAYSDPFPLMDATAGQTTTLTTSGAATNAITLSSDNTIRGLTVGNTTGAKIFGNNFGTVTIGDNTSPDVTLNGAGQALNLTTGTFAPTTGFVSIASTSSSTQGIVLTGVAGAANFGSTNISGSATQGILIGNTTASIDFGNTVVSGGTDGVSLQNNSSGTRTFGTLNITSTGANTSFLHAVGGGATIAGTTTISNGTGTGIDIQNATTTVSFGPTTITKSGAGTAVNINGTNGNVTFTGVSLGTAGTRLTGPAVVINGGTGSYHFGATSIFTNGVTAFSATNAGGMVSTASGTIDATGGSAIVINGPAGNTTLGMTLTTVNSNGGINNVSFVNCGGTATLNGGTLTGTVAGSTFYVDGGSVGIIYSGGITQGANAAMVSVGGGHATGAITFQTGTLSATNGTGLQFNNADGTYNFNGTTTLSGGDAGVDILNGSTGTFNFSNGTAITNPSGTAFNLSGATASNANVTYSGNISTNTAQAVNIDNHDAGTITFQTGNITGTAQGIAVTNCTAGTVNFNNPTISLTTGANTAVNLATNAGSAINFAPAGGGNGLDISTTTGTGFNATGGGTINVTGTGNTIIKSGNGTAININGTNAGAGGINFASVNVTGGTGQAVNITTSTGTKSLGDVDVARSGGGTGIFASNAGTLNTTTGTINSGNQIAIDIDNTVLGMVLERVDVNGALTGIDLNTTTGSFTVAGDGGVTNNGSGGTITGSTTVGVNISSATAVTLNYMIITASIDDGIRGATVTGFNMSRTNVTNNGNAVGDRGIEMTGLFGSGSMSNCTVTGSAETNIRISNDGGGTLTAFNVTSCTIGNTNMTTGDDGILFLNNGNGGMTISVTNSTFTDNKGDHFQAASDADASGTINVTFNNNTLSTTAANDPNVIGGGITINTSGSLDIIFEVNNNNIQQAFDDAININLDPGSLAGASMIGTISGNTIGTAAGMDSGSESSNCITVAAKGVALLTINVLNNIIRQWGNGYGILVSTSEGSAAINATITGNNVKNPGTFAINGIHAMAGATAADNGIMCLALTGNDATLSAGVPPGDTDIRIRQRFNTTIRLPGYAGANNNTVAVNTFVSGNNTGGPTVSSTHNVGGGGFGYVGGAACPTN